MSAARRLALAPAPAAVADRWQRVGRTVLTLAIAFPSFAPVALALLALVHAPDGSNLAVWTGTLALWITGASAWITHLLANPRVNELLARVNLGASTAQEPAFDSETRAWNLADFAGAGH
jgi:hypothetical protein